jgi:tetratricopeptide (TPR) repeat protein
LKQRQAKVHQLLSQAFGLHQAGRIDEAADLYRQVLAADPRQIDALNHLAATYLQRGDRGGFVRFIRKSLAIHPAQPHAWNNQGIALLDLKQYAEALECFDRAVTLDPGFAIACHNRGNALQRLERYADAIASYALAINLQPALAEAHREQGSALLALKMHDAALACYDRAITLKTDDCDAHFGRGCALARLNRHDNAVLAYRRALEIKPQGLGILNNLAVSLHEDGQLQAAKDCFEEILRRQPKFPHAQTNLGRLLQQMDRVEESLVRYDTALALDPGWENATWNKSQALLALGRYREGWELFETGLKPDKWRGIAVDSRRWDGSPFPGKTLLIRSEQGLGDTLQFVRYAALCKERGGKVMVLCEKPLLRLLNNCPYIDAAVNEVRQEEFDYQIAMLSLPHVFGTTLEDVPAAIPYLYCDPELREQWATRLAGSAAPKVGLVWAGNPREHQPDAQRIDQRRSISLAQMQPLLDVDGIDFYSLQLGNAGNQIDALGLRERIVDPTPQIADFMDTAALMHSLDLVICVDTSVVHLAGGLGRPVWVLSRFDACWRWLRNKPSNPWYPSARIFGQPSAGDWDSVIAQVREALAREFTRPSTAIAPPPQSKQVITVA